MQYRKVKSAAKRVHAKGPALEQLVCATMKMASDVVGATLGPGGMPVLIERQEFNMPPIITKDGVTVFRNLGVQDPTAQVILEAARDAAIRTASEAGDGTTTATVISEALVRHTFAYVRENPLVGPQVVTRRIERLFRDEIEPFIRECALHPEGETEEDLTNSRGHLLYAVAKTSANGDSDLADRVLECYDLVGDDGNVTIVEVSGPSRYEVERVEGYPIGLGYEECCGKFYTKFVNDPANQRVHMIDPCFLLYHGRITDIQALVPLMEAVGKLWQKGDFRHNIVIVATGYSETVLANLATNFAEQTTLNVYPCLPPVSADPNGQLRVLEDLSARTGARILDQLNAPLTRATVDDLGFGPGLTAFEATRFRSTVFGMTAGQEEEVLVRADQVKAQIAQAPSEYDAIMLQEQLGKLTGGIARLKVIGASNGETKEKRDRAEDAVCAVRGAIKDGCLPGGGAVLARVSKMLADKYGDDAMLQKVLIPALLEPVRRLLANCGYLPAEAEALLAKIQSGHQGVFDAVAGVFVDPRDGGVVDSVPAVLEAIRNSLSIASVLGTLGGTVVYARDSAVEQTEARDAANFMRDLETNPANERAS